MLRHESMCLTRLLEAPRPPILQSIANETRFSLIEGRIMRCRPKGWDFGVVMQPTKKIPMELMLELLSSKRVNALFCFA